MHPSCRSPPCSCASVFVYLGYSCRTIAFGAALRQSCTRWCCRRTRSMRSTRPNRSRRRRSVACAAACRHRMRRNLSPPCRTRPGRRGRRPAGTTMCARPRPQRLRLDSFRRRRAYYRRGARSHPAGSRRPRHRRPACRKSRSHPRPSARRRAPAAPARPRPQSLPRRASTHRFRRRQRSKSPRLRARPLHMRCSGRAPCSRRSRRASMRAARRAWPRRGHGSESAERVVGRSSAEAATGRRSHAQHLSCRAPPRRGQSAFLALHAICACHARRLHPHGANQRLRGARISRCSWRLSGSSRCPRPTRGSRARRSARPPHRDMRRSGR